MDKIYLAKVNNYYADNLSIEIENIFNNFEILSSLNSNSKILLKPNLIAKYSPDAGVTTHPLFVKSIIKELQKRNVTNIILADSCGGPAGNSVMKSVYRASGMEKLCKEENILLYNESLSTMVKYSNGKLVKEFELINIVNEVDLIINLPKLKTHVMTGVTCATKNVFGLIPGLTKAELHFRFPNKNDFGDMLIDLNLTLGKMMHIVDGITSMQGDGPTGGTVYNSNVILASDNQYLLDTVVCKMFDFSLLDVPYLNAAKNRNLTNLTYTKENILNGYELITPFDNFEKPKSYKDVDFSGHIGFLSPFIKKFLSPRPIIDKSLCIGCKKCFEICPQHVIDILKGKAHINKKNCIKCFCCHEVCPANAIDIKSSNFFNLKI